MFHGLLEGPSNITFAVVSRLTIFTLSLEYSIFKMLELHLM